jgi:hypothetical protein
MARSDVAPALRAFRLIGSTFGSAMVVTDLRFWPRIYLRFQRDHVAGISRRTGYCPIHGFAACPARTVAMVEVAAS